MKKGRGIASRDRDGAVRNRSRRLTTMLAAVMAIVAVAVITAGCGASTTSSGTPAATSTGTTSSQTGTGTTKASSGGTVPSWIPASVKSQYAGYQYFSKLQKNPDSSYKAPSGKLTMCYNTAYLGNTFQDGVVTELKKLNQEYVTAGLAKSGVNVTNSNGSSSTQLQQLNTLVQDGCNVIFSFPGSPTALCSGVSNATQHHALFVTIEAPVYCPDSINVSWNGYETSYQGALAVAKALHGKGSVVVTQGIPGSATNTAETHATSDAFKQYPGISIAGTINGQWTASVAGSQMTSFLATHPQTVNGIFDAGDEDVSTEQALLNAGRPVAKENSITGECAVLALWKQHPQAMTMAWDQSPAAATYEAMYVVQEMLSGNKPVVGTIFYPVPSITKSNFSQWYKPSMTLNSSCIPDSKSGYAVANSYFKPLFTGGHPLKFTPKP